MNTRAQAATCIREVIQHHRSLTDVLQAANQGEQAAFIQALCYGTLRYIYRLKAVANQLLLKPLKPKDQDIFALLLVGLYQLLYCDTPHYAAVSETVNASKTLKKPWASGLLNKTLRRFLREKESLLKTADEKSSARTNHPNWFITACKKAWPEHWERILQANNEQAPMTLRINRNKTTRDEYLNLLTQEKCDAHRIPFLSEGITLNTPMAVHDLPHFSDGWCSVQDAAGQRAESLLDLKPGQRVLDACAAPGSKTTHLLEQAPELQSLVALDKDPARLAKVRQNMQRLDLKERAQTCLKLTLADATHVEQWWDGKPFDRILLDAPCSATGVIRRHPDIKYLRKESDIKKLAEQQFHLLTSLWPLLAEEGLLLYATCSVLPEENEILLKQFLNKQKSAKAVTFTLEDSLEQRIGHQILPGMEQQDGFYYALLTKKKKT